MRRHHSNIHWPSERSIPKAKESTQKQKIFVQSKEKRGFYVTSIRWRLGNLVTDLEEKKLETAERNAVLQKDIEHSIVTKQEGCLKENGNRMNSYTHNHKKLKSLIQIKKEGLENVILTGHNEDKRDNGKQEAIYLTCLCKWIMQLAGWGILAKE